MERKKKEKEKQKPTEDFDDFLDEGKMKEVEGKKKEKKKGNFED